jgi:hypothetical protein
MAVFGDLSSIEGDLSSIEGDEGSSCGDEGSSCSDDDIYEMLSEADTASVVSDDGEFAEALQHGTLHNHCHHHHHHHRSA